jgi:hypothetical protein
MRQKELDVPEPVRSSKKTLQVPLSEELDRIFLLLKTNLEAIKREQPGFFGTLKLEVNFREGQIETLALDRRQTFKY